MAKRRAKVIKSRTWGWARIRRPSHVGTVVEGASPGYRAIVKKVMAYTPDQRWSWSLTVSGRMNPTAKGRTRTLESAKNAVRRAARKRDQQRKRG